MVGWLTRGGSWRVGGVLTRRDHEKAERGVWRAGETGEEQITLGSTLMVETIDAKRDALGSGAPPRFPGSQVGPSSTSSHGRLRNVGRGSWSFWWWWLLGDRGVEVRANFFFFFFFFSGIGYDAAWYLPLPSFSTPSSRAGWWDVDVYPRAGYIHAGIT